VLELIRFFGSVTDLRKSNQLVEKIVLQTTYGSRIRNNGATQKRKRSQLENRRNRSRRNAAVPTPIGMQPPNPLPGIENAIDIDDSETINTALMVQANRSTKRCCRLCGQPKHNRYTCPWLTQYGDVIKDKQRDLRESLAQDLGRLDSAYECSTEVLQNMLESDSFPTKNDALVVRRRHFRPHNPPGKTLLFECVFFRVKSGKCLEFEGTLYCLDDVKSWIAKPTNKNPLVVCVPKTARQTHDTLLFPAMANPPYLQLSQLSQLSQMSQLSQNMF
jgi:hypothetical protein